MSKHDEMNHFFENILTDMNYKLFCFYTYYIHHLYIYSTIIYKFMNDKFCIKKRIPLRKHKYTFIHRALS